MVPILHMCSIYWCQEPATPLPPPRLLLPVCLLRRYLPPVRVGSESAAVRFWGWAAPVLRRTSRTPQPLQLISLGGAETRAGMRGALLLGAASCLEGGMGQDTGGPFKGSLAISRQTPGHCVDNRGHIIPEAMLFEPPGQDQCQVGG